jgi:Right handed beta helix region
VANSYSVANPLSITSAAHGCETLVVPTQYSTIQGAIDAAKPCDIVQVLPGTYAEQLVVNKSITLVGNSSSNTIIQAPSTLNKDFFGATYIVEVANEAKVMMAGFNVTGPAPGTGTCGGLTNGIEVLGGASLSLSSSIVTHIHDNPFAPLCDGYAVSVGPSTDAGIQSVGHLFITGVTITDYQAIGIDVGGVGSTATIVGNTITGDGYSEGQNFQYGIDVYQNSTTTIKYNTISNNQCTYEGEQAEDCGLAIHGASQTSGIFVGYNIITKNVIEHNTLFNNDEGIYVENGYPDVLPSKTVVAYNTIINSTEYGVELQDINDTISNNLIVGGLYGVAIGADYVNSTATLVKDTFAGQALADWQTQSYDGYIATVVVKK